MGASESSPEVRYKRELLKLSWRLALTIQDQAVTKKSSSALDEQKSKAAMTFRSDKMYKPFHVDFEVQFFKYCPDLSKKFPTDFSLVSRMIQTFVTKAIESKSVGELAKRFSKSHQKYRLKQEHFNGFSEALVDTLQVRLGKFGTIELIKIWREVTDALVSVMQREYNSSR
ncbi:hypothetical protein AAMO2058_000325600 [Amorphochlora amoebiformis]|uniref:Globin domain-containing protein n=1 Tax=Amorphochlora amoebiformis TaxID=1561963 RepID=A0A7S0GSU3_9EUKA|mmetsp:Transcript_16216/g.25698  ORF Transcript_16216/g.25698 Transcript_16216/m.25698 type:complete len:171 (+) Transcript_16216:98-610(+)